MNAKELIILQKLRKNARYSLTEISYLTYIPLSSVFKKVIKLEKDVIKKYISLINFELIGFSIRINLILKSKDKETLKKFLLEHPNVNSLYRISQNFDFFVETVFPSMLEFENFAEELDSLISNKKAFHIIEDLCREDFMLIEDEKVE